MLINTPKVNQTMTNIETPSMSEPCLCGHLAMIHHHRGQNFNKGRCLAPNCDCNRFTYENGKQPPLDKLEINPRKHTPSKLNINPIQKEIDMAIHMWMVNGSGHKESLCKDPDAKPTDKSNPLHKKAPICRQCFNVQSDVLTKKILRLEKELKKQS